jgi:hypothetical protein
LLFGELAERKTKVESVDGVQLEEAVVVVVVVLVLLSDVTVTFGLLVVTQVVFFGATVFGISLSCLIGVSVNTCSTK